MTQTEKRKHKRFSFHLTTEICKIAAAEDQGLKYITCTCRDISNGGLSFFSFKQFERGDILRVRVILSESRFMKEKNKEDNTLHFLAKVMYSRFAVSEEFNLTGVEFLNIYQGDYDILCSYLVEVMGENKSFEATSRPLCLSRKSSVKQID